MLKRCFLIGPMASGKTYWGRVIARATGLPFTDLDTAIEQLATKSVHSIFADHGEEYFRETERAALHAQETAPPGIVATGGGTPCFFDNMDWMNAHGKTIYLETPADVLLARQRLDKTVRPLLQGVSEHDLEAYLEKMIRQREQWYRRAQVIMPYHADNETFEKMLLEQVRMEE